MATMISRISDLITALGTDYKALVAADKVVAVNAQTGTTYTLALADAGKAVEVANAASIALTVPPNGTIAFPIGTVLEIAQTGAGVITITPGAGVTLLSRGSALKTNGQYAMAYLRKTGTNTWMVGGDLIP